MTVPAKTSVVVRMTLAPNKLEMIAPKVGTKEEFQQNYRNSSPVFFCQLVLIFVNRPPKWTRVAR